jgi:hypothetical protein
MKIFYLICILIFGFILIKDLFNILNTRYKFRAQKLYFIKLKRFKKLNYFYIILGLLIICISIAKYNHLNNDYEFVFWLLFGIYTLINVTIYPGEYFYFNADGIKDSKMIPWESIKKINRNEYMPSELKFVTDKNNIIIDFYTEENIEQLKVMVKDISLTAYELLKKI